VSVSVSLNGVNAHGKRRRNAPYRLGKHGRE
jgi:hypothetical protein